MSVESLCQGDQVVKQTEVNTPGAAFGKSLTYTNGSTLDCLIQTVSDSESNKYQTTGMLFTHQVFFAENPALSSQNRLKWTVKDESNLSSAAFLRVLACYREGRPGDEMLWIADCSEEQTRLES